MSVVEIKIDLDQFGVQHGDVLAERFRAITAELRRHKALTGLTSLQVATVWTAMWSTTPGEKAHQLVDAVALNDRKPEEALQRYAADFPTEGYVGFREINFAPLVTTVELHFKDSAKAMLFKLSV